MLLACSQPCNTRTTIYCASCDCIAFSLTLKRACMHARIRSRSHHHASHASCASPSEYAQVFKRSLGSFLTLCSCCRLVHRGLNFWIFLPRSSYSSGCWCARLPARSALFSRSSRARRCCSRHATLIGNDRACVRPDPMGPATAGHGGVAS